MALKDYVTGTTNKILLGSAAGVGLIVTLVAGVSLYSPAYQVRDSNGLVKWAVNFRGDSTQSGAIASKTLTAANCDVKGTSTGMLICGTDATGAGGGSAWSGTGALQTYFDPRYVNTSGDTMTGKLLINLASGTDALEVVQTASASKLHANTLLTVSGSVVVEDNLNVDGLMSFVGYSSSPQLTATDTTTGIHFDGPGIVSVHNGGIQTMLLSSTNNVGFGIGAPKTKLEVSGILSGVTLYATRSLSGAGLVDCDTAGTSKLLWDSTTGRFSCGTDTDTNTTYTAGKGLTLTSTAFSTNDTLTGTMLRFLTVSGSLVYGKMTLASSGTIVAEGAMSGASLFVGTSIRGSGLTDCDIAGTSKLLWDTTTGRFSCGTDTDTNTTYTAGQGLTLAGTVFRLTASHSGSVIQATTTLSSSGTLVVEGTTSGAIIVASSQFSGAGLTSCSSATSKLLWNSTTNRFSCGTDSDTTYTAGQGLTLSSTSFRTNATLSGVTLWATTALRSSGSLVVEGTASGATFIGNTISGATLRGRYISPRYLSTEVFASGSTIAVGSGKVMLTIPDTMSGYKLETAHLSVGAAGTTNTTAVQIRNLAKNARKFFSTVLSIDSAETGSDTAATPVAITAANADVGAYDRLMIDVVSVSTTPPKSPMIIILKFYKP